MNAATASAMNFLVFDTQNPFPPEPTGVGRTRER